MNRLRLWIGYQDLAPALVRYLAAVSILGPIVAVGWSLLGPADDRPNRWPLAAMLVMLGCLAERFPIQLTHKTYINVASAVYVGMLLTLPLPMCGVAALFAVATAQVLRFRSNPELGIADPFFNTGQTSLYVTCAAAFVLTIERVNLPSVNIGSFGVWQIIVASLTLHLVNTALVAGASARHLELGTFRVWRHNLMVDAGPHAGMTLVGLCAAQLGLASPLMLPALAFPAVLVHRAVQQSVQLRANVRAALASLVEIVELRDPYTAGHSRRVATLARNITVELGMTAEEADLIENAGNVHDLGKVAIDPAILLKPGKLTDIEWAEMKLHPVLGANVLNQFESYRDGIPLIRGHHEAWDGSGYPDQISGDSIPIGARILAVADTYDALTSDRPYRDGMEHERARKILQDGSGSQWDPQVVSALLRLLDRMHEVSPVPETQVDEQRATAAARLDERKSAA